MLRKARQLDLVGDELGFDQAADVVHVHAPVVALALGDEGLAALDQIGRERDAVVQPGADFVGGFEVEIELVMGVDARPQRDPAAERCGDVVPGAVGRVALWAP